MHKLPLTIFTIFVLIGSTSATLTQFSSSPLSRVVINARYHKGCSAIMKGFNQIDDYQYRSYGIFGTWEYRDPNGQFMNSFENRKGIVKITISTDRNEWYLYVTFYDGDYIDLKYAQISDHLYFENSSPDMTINQANGTLQTKQNYTFSVWTSERWPTISGQISLYFLDRLTKVPITDFQKPDISDYTVQLNINSSTSSSYSITTSLFSHLDDISIANQVILYVFVATYLIVGLFSWYTKDLARKVSFLSLCATFLSSGYIVVWMTFWFPTNSCLYMILLSAFIFDLLKHLFFLLKADASIYAKLCAIGICSLIDVFFAMRYFFNKMSWINLYPSIPLLVPIAIQMTNPTANPQPFITRFQISNWLCQSLWMTYVHLNPYNAFLLSPKPAMALIFFGIILSQYFTALHAQNKRRRNYEALLAMYHSEEALRLASLREQIYNPVHDEQPVISHRYTLIVKKEDPTKLKNDCAICFEDLLGGSEEKLYKTPCGHIFHEVCLRAWGIQKLDCPCCRKKLPIFR